MVTGLESQISEAVAIYTRAGMDSLYVLDRGDRRVVVMGKDGNYERQYVWEGLAAAEGLAVDESTGQVYVSVGTSIYRLEAQ